MGSVESQTTLGQSFDPIALQEKYREERDKRIHNGDVWSSPVPWQPVSEEVDYLVVGAGYSGMLLSVRLLEAGITSIRIVDKAGDFGGTWYWNRYPGAACDIESYIYMPLLEETGYVASEKYARGPELFAHSQRIGKHYKLYDRALFHTEVDQLNWNETTKRWDVRTSRGDYIQARFVTTAGGLLHKLKFPGVDGIENFKGHSFHSSRWDYEYTGGDHNGNLTGLADKRVAIIGTGATAIQLVPHLGQSSKHLYVFQRTPSSVDVRLDQPTDPEWARNLSKGWQQRRMDNFNILVSGDQQDEDQVGDGWTDILVNLSISGQKVAASRKARDPIKAAQGLQNNMQMANYHKMKQVRARVESTVNDPATAAALKPWYNLMCKRPCFHNEYLKAFNRPNVTLVDTKGQGIDRITEKGIIANGVEHEVDCIVYATGFDYVGTDYSKRMRIAMRGRDGISLNDYWKDGPRTLHGLHTHRFPNHFIMSITQSAVALNFTNMLNEQAKHIAFIVSEAQKRGATTIEASGAAEEDWVQTIIKLGKLREDFLRECTPSYYNDEGNISEKTLKTGRYGLGSPAFIQLLKGWREDGGMLGLELDGKPAAKSVPEPTSKNSSCNSV